jgi:hypothetical protein
MAGDVQPHVSNVGKTPSAAVDKPMSTMGERHAPSRVDTAPCLSGPRDYRSGPHSAWIKVRNPTSIAVQRDRSENWNK